MLAEEFLLAISRADVATVTTSLEEGINANLVSVNGNYYLTPLAVAVISDKNGEQADVVKILLKYQADPDIEVFVPYDFQKPSSPCQLAWEKQKQGLLKLLVPRSRLLKWAVQDHHVHHNQQTWIKVLLHEYDADPDQAFEGQSAFDLAVELQNQDCIKWLVTKSNVVKKSMFEAAKNGDKAGIQQFLGYGFDVNAVNEENQTLLQVAVLQNKKNISKVLLAFGADPDAKQGGGKSALEIAREQQDKDIIELLTPYSLQAKAEPDPVFNQQGNGLGQVDMTSKNNHAASLSKSAMASGKLSAAILLRKWKEADALLAQGVDFNTVPPERLKNLKDYQYEITNDYPNLQVEMQKIREKQLALWRKHTAGKNHPLIVNLDDEINRIQDDNLKNALIKLRHDLNLRIDKQRNKKNTKDGAFQIAAYTIEMLINLRRPQIKNQTNEEYNEYRLGIVRRYESNCKKQPKWVSVMQGIAMVIFAAVGFVLGAVVGIGVGTLAGIWSGPGTFVTAALGLVTGAVIGVAEACVIGTAVLGGVSCFGSLALGGRLLFKASTLRQEANDVAVAATMMLKAK